MDMYVHSTGWIQDDFADTLDTELGEEDPWTAGLEYNKAAAEPSDSVQAAERQNTITGRATTIDYDAANEVNLDSPESVTWYDDQDSGFEPQNKDSFVEMETIREWDESQSEDMWAANPGTFGDMEFDYDHFDEPEPQAEYDSELSQPIYETDRNTSDLHRDIRINQWLAGIEDMSDVQRQEIVEALQEFSAARLRSWLPWLCRQQWTGQSLLLFLQFRAYWDETPYLWESSFWNPRLGFWHPTWSRYSLSRDDQFDLIQLRMDFPPPQVIDQTWFDDWEEFDLWKYGYEAFTDFVLLRASLRGHEDWRRHINWDLSCERAGSKLQSEAVGSNDALTSQLHVKYRKVFWFAFQDWYDPAEWHDGLDW